MLSIGILKAAADAQHIIRRELHMAVRTVERGQIIVVVDFHRTAMSPREKPMREQGHDVFPLLSDLPFSRFRSFGGT